MDNFQYAFDVPTMDFKKTEEKLLWVRPEIKQNNMGKPILKFRLTIPKHVYNKVFSTEKKYAEEYIDKNYISPVLNKKRRFRQEIRSPIFSDLVSAFNEICMDAMQVQSVIDSEQKKVILIKFSHEEVDTKDSWNYAQTGKKIKGKFQFFICYKRQAPDHFHPEIMNTVYESLEQQSHGLQNQIKGYGFKGYWDLNKKAKTKEGIDFNEVKWTEEREIYFTKVQQGFIELYEHLDKFLKEIDEAKMVKLLSMNKLLLSAPEEE